MSETHFDDFDYAKRAIALDGYGYDGPSMPSWYSADDLARMMSAAPEDATFQDVIADVFDVAIVGDNWMMARNVPAERVREVHQLLLAQEGSSTTVDIGEMGEDAFDGYYRRVQGIAEINSARIPFCVECWAEAESIEKGEDASSLFYPLINRSAALSYLWCNSDSIGLNISGCGLSFKVGGPKRAEYGITLSVITPSYGQKLVTA